MQLSSVLFALLAATAVSARGGDGRGRGANSNSTEPVTDSQKCKALEHMQSLVGFAANTTRLGEKTGNDAAKMAEIQAKASDAAAKVSELQSNATLMATCSGIFAMEETMGDCERMQRIQDEMALAANDTRLADKFDGNKTRIDEFKARLADKSSQLTGLQANTTLTGICAAAETMGDCLKMAALQKMAERASNDTLLASKFHGNQTKIDDFKSKAAEAQTKLAAMQANTTLTDICNNAAPAHTEEGKSAADTAGSTPPPSAAIRSTESASRLIAVAFIGVTTMLMLGF